MYLGEKPITGLSSEVYSPYVRAGSFFRDRGELTNSFPFPEAIVTDRVNDNAVSWDEQLRVNSD